MPVAAGGRWRLGARFVFRTGRRALVESLYLLTAPVIPTVDVASADGAPPRLSEDPVAHPAG